MAPDVSRRNLLVGIGALGGTYGVSTQIGIGSIPMWSPSKDRWPLPRYDLQRSGTTAAALPQNPSKEWTVQPLSDRVSIIVGAERVYAGTSLDGASSSPGVVALNRRDGSVVWTAPDEEPPLALHDGTLYAKAHNPDNGAVVALDTATGDRQWRSTHPSGVGEIAPTDGTVFFEHTYGVAAVDAGSGRNRWSASSGGAGAVALGDGAVFGAVGDITRYEPRRVSDVVFGDSPPTSWTYNARLAFADVAIIDDTLLVTSYLSIPDPELRSMHALDLHDGTRRWWAVRGVDERENSPIATGGVAVADGMVFHRLRRGQDMDRSHALVARSLGDGAKQWEKTFRNWVSDIAVADGTLLVGQPLNPRTNWRGVRAFDPAGNEQWRVRTRRDPQSIAPVEGAVFVGSDGGRVTMIS